MSQLIDVPLTSKMIGGRGQRAVRALLQGRVRLMKEGSLLGDLVQRSDRGLARVVVVKIPGSQLAVLRHARSDLDHAGRAEIGPRELLFAGPHDFDRLA